MNKTIKNILYANIKFYINPIVILSLIFILWITATFKIISPINVLGFTQQIFSLLILGLFSDYFSNPFKYLILSAHTNRKEYFRAKFYFYTILFCIIIISSNLLDLFAILFKSHFKHKMLIIDNSIITQYLEIYPFHFIISLFLFAYFIYINFNFKSKSLTLTLTGVIIFILYIISIFILSKQFEKLEFNYFNFNIPSIIAIVVPLTMLSFCFTYKLNLKKFLNSDIL